MTSSNGIDVINAINGDPSPSGGAVNPLNYPVGTVTIFQALEGSSPAAPGVQSLTGGHADNRIEGYIGDTFNVFPNLNVSFGVNYVRDSGRTDGDLAPVPCSAINTTIVRKPHTGAAAG